ncbi:MAG: DNA-directed DNA polymerase II small subunit [Candidatus Woesearchaeota archaeon]
MEIEEKKAKVAQLMRQNILVTPELLSQLEEKGYVEIEEHNMDWKAGEKTAQKQSAANVKVVFSYNKKPQKRHAQDFISYFNSRYSLIESLLINRQGLSNITSISRVRGRPADSISIIGAVYDKHETKSGNIMLTIEDRTGLIKVLVSSTKKELLQTAKEIVHDEIIGITGSIKQDIMFANNIIFPDIITQATLKKSPEEGYAVFLSDLHVGSEMFLSAEFERFIKWVNGNLGSETQKDIALKVKYIFMAGDAVDGIGVYPNQQAELKITDIYAQYEEYARLMEQIPSHIQIIMCPGNHDAMRISEPQPPFAGEFSARLAKMPNVTLISNPALVNIDSSNSFSGLNVLVYHGYSFDYYIANIDSIRQKGGYDRADLVMKFLLKRRHLAPSHTSTLYLPDAEKDPLFIDIVPDIFATGHLHKTSASHYKNVTLICGSCWQSKTPFQEKLGHNPEPARVPVINLHTRDVKILKFGADSYE